MEAAGELLGWGAGARSDGARMVYLGPPKAPASEINSRAEIPDAVTYAYPVGEFYIACRISGVGRPMAKRLLRPTDYIDI